MLSADGTLSQNYPMRRDRNWRTTLFVGIVGVLWRVGVFEGAVSLVENGRGR